MEKSGFTLVELLAVIVILGVVLLISLPVIKDTVRATVVNAFEIDAKMIIKSIDYKIIENKDYDITTIDVAKLSTDLKISVDNLQSISVENSNGSPYIYLVGKNKWEGLTACGTYSDITVKINEVCPRYLYNEGSYASSWEEGFETAGADSIRTKASDHLLISTNSDINEVLGEETSFVLMNDIDLTNYTTLYIDWERLTPPAGFRQRELHSINISALSGKYFIRVHNKWAFGAMATWAGISTVSISTIKDGNSLAFDLNKTTQLVWAKELRIYKIWLE